MWKTLGNENIIITCLYDADVKVENKKIIARETITLYNDKEIEKTDEITVGADQLDATVEVAAKNQEETIYKGKLNAGINRDYQTTTQLKVNLAKVDGTIELIENNSQDIKVIYQTTTIKKEQFDKIFGQNGMATIYDQNGEIVGTITNETPVDQEGNIVINYGERQVTAIRVQITQSMEEGTLTFHHTKTICATEEAEKIKEVNELKNTITANEKTIETTIKLENAITQATIETNKESLSTVVENNVEIKAVLTSDDEKYNLYKNPQIAIELPEEVEKIAINSIDLLYEDELKISNYNINGRTINVSLEGEQTNYKEETLEGATIVMNTNIGVNRKASTKDEEIKMTYQNKETANTSKAIKIVAPTDLTTVHTIQGLNVETLGEEEKRQVMMPRGAEEQPLEARNRNY